MTTAAPTAAGYFCLRAPLLPFAVFEAWSETGTGQPGRVARLRVGLQRLLAQPALREAIFLASPALEEAIAVWETRPECDQARRVERSLLKYLGRMTTRPTPFGLFAAVSTGTIGDRTALLVPDRGRLTRHTRLDCELLFQLVRGCTAAPGARDGLTYYPTDSLHFAAGHGHYYESRVDDEGHHFHLVSVEESEALTTVFDRARTGATRRELAATLVQDDTSLEEATAYIDQLIDSQLLVPALDLQVTGPEPSEALTPALARLPGAESDAAAVQAAEQELAALDHAGLGNSPGQYRAVAQALAPLVPKIELSRLFQTDLVRAEAGTLSGAVIDEIGRAVLALQRLAPRRPPGSLDRFIELYRDRYQDRSVPLLEALDQETGIGGAIWPADDPSPILKDLPLTRPAAESMSWGRRESHLLHRLSEISRSGADQWILTPEDLERLVDPDPLPLPDSFSILTTLAAASPESVARGDYQLLLTGASSPASALLGRFCHADPALRAQVLAQHQAEAAARPDDILAEVVHLPGGRTGNIILRPSLRQYEITFLGRGSAPRDRQIPADDLMIRLVGEGLELWSKRLGRRVIPCLASAHNVSRGLLPYRFLCELQSHRTAWLGWHWGPLGSAAFLPRVRLGRMVLSLATWRLDQSGIEKLTRGPTESRLVELERFRTSAKLPRWITLADDDNRLPVDLDNPLSADCLLHELTGQNEARLQELWPAPEQLLAAGPEGHFRHELVVPFLGPPADAKVAWSRPPVTASHRKSPGSDWLYLKMYTHPAGADRLLTEVMGPMTRDWADRGVIDDWFFIRYRDPEFHLRWRLRGEPDALQVLRSEIDARLGDEMSQGRVWRLATDTYDREIERFGGDRGIELAERLFTLESVAVVELLELLDPGDAGFDERWRLGLAGADRWLRGFGLSHEEVLETITNSRGYGTVMPEDAALRRSLSERFRKLRPELEALLGWNGGEDHPLAPGLELLREFGERAAEVAEEYHRLAERGALTVPLTRIAGSFIHMFLNRLLRDSANAHETVLYEFLHRCHVSQAARSARLRPALESSAAP